MQDHKARWTINTEYVQLQVVNFNSIPRPSVLLYATTVHDTYTYKVPWSVRSTRPLYSTRTKGFESVVFLTLSAMIPLRKDR